MTRLKPYLLPGGAILILVLAAGATLFALNSPPGPQPAAYTPADLPTARPLIAYLSPTSGTPHNLLVMEPVVGAEPVPLTDSEQGVLMFAPAPDGSRIAYSEYNASGGADLKLLDLTTATITTLVACSKAECTAPAWHPDGTRLAYEHIPVNPPVDDEAHPVQVHVLDLRTTPPTDTPLTPNAEDTSAQPIWAPDGTRLAAYDGANGGIILVDTDGGETGFLPALHGSVGTFSPDGTQLVYPEIDFLSEATFYTHLRLVDLETGTVTPLDAPDSPADDERAIWTPDGTLLVVSRRYMDDRFTPGRQLYLVSPETGDTKPLVIDDAYYHGAFAFDPAGERLVIQRLRAPSGVGAVPTPPEIWLYGLADDKLVPLVADAFLPAWLP